MQPLSFETLRPRAILPRPTTRLTVLGELQEGPYRAPPVDMRDAPVVTDPKFVAGLAKTYGEHNPPPLVPGHSHDVPLAEVKPHQPPVGLTDPFRRGDALDEEAQRRGHLRNRMEQLHREVAVSGQRAELLEREMGLLRAERRARVAEKTLQRPASQRTDAEQRFVRRLVNSTAKANSNPMLRGTTQVIASQHDPHARTLLSALSAPPDAPVKRASAQPRPHASPVGLTGVSHGPRKRMGAATNPVGSANSAILPTVAAAVKQLREAGASTREPRHQGPYTALVDRVAADTARGVQRWAERHPQPSAVAPPT